MKKKLGFLLFFITIFIFSFFVFYEVEEIDTSNNYTYHEEKIINDNELIELIDIGKLRDDYSNNDIVGVIKIDSLSLESIVVKGIDNDFYLSHDLNKNTSQYGTEFVDFRNDDNLSKEKQINIYGHNSRYKEYHSKLEFSKLGNIVDKNIFDNLSNIYFYIDNDVLVYKPLIAKVIITDYEYTRLKLDDKEVLKKHLTNLSSNAMYCNGDCKIDEGNDVIVLQTCYYDPVGSYLLLIGVK